MTRYLISFDDGAMTFPDEELPDVAKAAMDVVEEAKQPVCGCSAAGWTTTRQASWAPTGP
jgi:hypothetical protein